MITHVERSYVPSANRFGFRCALLFMIFQIPASMAVAQSAKLQDKAHSIDPFTAADSGGNVFVGPTLPFGMVKPDPDMNIGENENPLWESNEPYYDDYYAIWDTFRCASPLLTFIAPQREPDIVRSLVDCFRQSTFCISACHRSLLNSTASPSCICATRSSNSKILCVNGLSNRSVSRVSQGTLICSSSGRITI